VSPLTILAGLLPSGLRGATEGGAFCADWEAGSAAAAGLAVIDRAPLWPASARRQYTSGHAHGHAATTEYLRTRVTLRDLSMEEHRPVPQRA
jgi:hypothetical protein